MQLLNFGESIGKLNTSASKEIEHEEEEFEKLKIIANTKTVENKSLLEELEKIKQEVNVWRNKLVDESERNNEYSKDLIVQIKDLQAKNFELQKADKKLKNDAVMNTLKEKNQMIFKLEEQLKDKQISINKLKKTFLQKEIQLREDLEKESQLKLKETSTRFDTLEDENKRLEQMLKRRESILEEKQQELKMVYSKMEEISSQIENKSLDNNFKKLSKHNSELVIEKSKLEAQVNSLSDKIKNREEIITNLEGERDNLFKKLFDEQRQFGSVELNKEP